MTSVPNVRTVTAIGNQRCSRHRSNMNHSARSTKNITKSTTANRTPFPANRYGRESTITNTATMQIKVRKIQVIFGQLMHLSPDIAPTLGEPMAPFPFVSGFLSVSEVSAFSTGLPAEGVPVCFAASVGGV